MDEAWRYHRTETGTSREYLFLPLLSPLNVGPLRETQCDSVLSDNIHKAGQAENTKISSSCCCLVNGRARAGGDVHPQKVLSCQVKGSGLLRISEASHRLSFLFSFFLLWSWGLPPSQEERAWLTGIVSSFQGELYSWRCAPRQRLGEKEGRGPDQSCL